MQLTTVAEMRRVLRPGGRIIIVDMQPIRKISAAFSIIALIHSFHSRATHPDWEKIEELLARQGVQLVRREPLWSGTVRAIVGRISPRSAEGQTVSTMTVSRD
jgi:SAM-dependent methyltransferase